MDAKQNKNIRVDAHWAQYVANSLTNLAEKPAFDEHDRQFVVDVANELNLLLKRAGCRR